MHQHMARNDMSTLPCPGQDLCAVTETANQECVRIHRDSLPDSKEYYTFA